MTEIPPPVPSGTPYPGMVTPPESQSSTKNNWQGIVAAITGLLGIGLLGVLFGALGLQSVKARTATNRGLALTGLIAGGFWMVAGFVVAVGVGVAGWGAPTGSTFTSFEDLKVGDCFAKHGDVLEGEEMSLIDGLYVVDCARQHYGEVYFIGTMTETSFPGLEESSAIADKECFGERAIGMLDLDKAGELLVSVLFPSSDSWDEGDREYVCMVIAETEDLAGSVLLAP